MPQSYEQTEPAHDHSTPRFHPMPLAALRAFNMKQSGPTAHPTAVGTRGIQHHIHLSKLAIIRLTRLAFRNWFSMILLTITIMVLRRHPLLYRASWKIHGARVTLRTTNGVALRLPLFDIIPAIEVFALHEYDYSIIPWSRVDTVIDCGANVGSFSIWLLNKSSCRILAVEPNPLAFALLKSNVRPFRNRISTVSSALAGHQGIRRLYSVAESSGTTFFGHADGAIGCFDVPTMSLDDLINYSGFSMIDLLKMDVEGAEQEVFETVSSATLQRIGTMIIECHPALGTDVSLIVSKLECAGMVVSREDLRGTSLIVARRDQSDHAAPT